jgi:ADP-ribose pyrophosphatase YjhB (NUDIX family)
MTKVTCKGLFGEVVEVDAEELRFRPSIYGLVVRDGKILLCPQWDGWDYPGGGIDKGELMMDALVREVKEETGLIVQPAKLLDVSDNFFQPTFAKEQHWHSIKMYFVCDYVSGEISSDGFMEYEKTYMKEAQWVPIEDTPGLKFYNSTDNAKLIAAAKAHCESASLR